MPNKSYKKWKLACTSIAVASLLPALSGCQLSTSNSPNSGNISQVSSTATPDKDTSGVSSTGSRNDTDHELVVEVRHENGNQGLKYFVAAKMPNKIYEIGFHLPAKVITHNGYVCLLNDDKPQGLVVAEDVKLEKGQLINSDGNVLKIGEFTNFKSFGIPEYWGDTAEVKPVIEACNADSALVIHPH